MKPIPIFIYRLACMNVNINKTEIQDKVVLLSCLLLSDNPYFEESQKLLEVLLTLANECLDYVFFSYFKEQCFIFVLYI